jgi:hypothetical protein
VAGSLRLSIVVGSFAQALTESDAVLEAEIAWAWRWIICSMKLYDDVAALEELPDAADVIVTFDPSA